MEESVQVLALLALPVGKYPLVPVEYEAVWVPEPV